MVIDAGLSSPVGAADPHGRQPVSRPVAFACAQAALVPPDGRRRARVLPDADDPHRRPPTLPYLAQIATACDALGFEGMLTPCGTGCEDAWLATAPLLPLTRRVKFLVAFRPALLSRRSPRRWRRPTNGLGRAPARQHRDRRRAGRARPLRRLGRQGDALRAHRGVRARHAGRLEWRAVRLPGRALQRRRRDDARNRRNRSRASTSAVRPKRPNGSPPSTSTCTSRGANRRRWCRNVSRGCAGWPGPPAGRSTSAFGST